MKKIYGETSKFVSAKRYVSAIYSNVAYLPSFIYQSCKQQDKRRTGRNSSRKTFGISRKIATTRPLDVNFSRKQLLAFRRRKRI